MLRPVTSRVPRVAPPQPARSHAAVAALTCVALLVTLPAGATTVLRQSWETLTHGAGVVLRGQVEAVEGFVPEGEGHPFRLARVRLVECLTGDCPAVAAVRTPGGSDALGRTWMVPGSPEFAVGDDVLLFLEPAPPETALRPTRPAGSAARGRLRPEALAVPAAGSAPATQWLPLSLAVGCFRVLRNASGEPVVVQDRAAAGAHQVGPVPTGAAVPSQATLAEAVAAVKAASAREQP